MWLKAVEETNYGFQNPPFFIQNIKKIIKILTFYYLFTLEQSFFLVLKRKNKEKKPTNQKKFILI
tara:strand:- start:196 stop:390 length:195 start_codon:yes stop_codon:yes gene_type:complete